IYSRLSRWEQRSFAATLQPIFMTMGAASVISKITLGSVDLNADAGLPLGWIVPGIVAAVLVGILIGTGLAQRVPVQAART
ncbi:hypothetical protein N3930_46760, partial [Bacillus thuringiensis]|nr:hypothetical protein [Bacillus thuringiensis]